MLQALARIAMNLWQTSLQGAQSAIYCATSPEAISKSGQYFRNCATLTMPKASLDEQACEQLFQRTLMEISQYDPVTAQKLAEAGYASTSSSSQ